MSKKTTALAKKKEAAKEVLEYFELDNVEEYKDLFQTMQERKKKYGFAICKNPAEALMVRSVLFFINDVNKVSALLGIKPAFLQALRDDIEKEGFFGNFLKAQNEKVIQTTGRIMDLGDKVAEVKLPLASAAEAAHIADTYFKRGRLLTNNSTENVAKVEFKYAKDEKKD